MNNFLSIITSVLPYVLKLLNDPAFQTILKQIEGDLNMKIAGGVAPAVATQQATGLLGAAAMLHLTGNPAADFQALVANFKPAAAAPLAGTFKS